MRTGTQILTALLSASVPTQLIKRATGREDPYRKSQRRGRWRPFDKNYDKDISAHDAVPSGHFMAATATFTVIDTNYPEYRNIIRPVGFTLLTILGFQMANIGVHWVSDYPLGAAIGYVVGKAAAGKKDKERTSMNLNQSQWSYSPILYSSNANRIYGLFGKYTF